MWIVGIILVGFIILISTITIREIIKEPVIKCKYCGHIFKKHSRSEVAEYEMGGEKKKAQECPKCGKYTDIR